MTEIDPELIRRLQAQNREVHKALTESMRPALEAIQRNREFLNESVRSIITPDNLTALRQLQEHQSQLVRHLNAQWAEPAKRLNASLSEISKFSIPVQELQAALSNISKNIEAGVISEEIVADAQEYVHSQQMFDGDLSPAADKMIKLALRYSEVAVFLRLVGIMFAAQVLLPDQGLREWIATAILELLVRDLSKTAKGPEGNEL